MARPSMKTSASSRLSRARKDSFCHIAFVHIRGGSLQILVTRSVDRQKGRLSNSTVQYCARDAQSGAGVVRLAETEACGRQGLWMSVSFGLMRCNNRSRRKDL